MLFTCPIIDNLEYHFSSVGISIKGIDFDGNHIQLCCLCSFAGFKNLAKNLNISCSPEEYIKLVAEGLGLIVSNFSSNYNYSNNDPYLLNISVGLIAKKIYFEVKSSDANKNNNLNLDHLGNYGSYYQEKTYEEKVKNYVNIKEYCGEYLNNNFNSAYKKEEVVPKKEEVKVLSEKPIVSEIIPLDLS